jgi:hypothetical protein
VSGYEYDVFISYSRRGSVREWINNHFFITLQECLADEIAPEPRVFLDQAMQRGVDWPKKLQRSLHRSKIMIAVLTPLYFTSPWCRAELYSMLAREAKLGLATLDCPRGLIYPILYSDSDNFPEEDVEALRRAWNDFKDLSTPKLVFQRCPEWIPFHRRVVEVARDVVDLLGEAPDWDADWPLIPKPDPLVLPRVRMPRLGR